MPAARTTRVIVTALTAALVGALPAPTGAYADQPLTLEVNTSATDTAPKSVVVTCPADAWVHAVGGWTTGGGGRALLTRMEPAADLRSAIVAARPATTDTTEFSVTVQAMCIRTQVPPQRVAATALLGDAVSVPCGDGESAVGFGFALQRPTDDWRVDQLLPNAALTRVSLHTAGTRPLLAPLTVFGICLPWPSSDPYVCRKETTPVTSGAWPRTAALPPTGLGAFGVGGVVTGLNTHLDGFLVLPFAGGSVRAARLPGVALPPLAARSGAAAAAVTTTSDAVTGYDTRIGTFYGPPC
ncbi:hypothetical protein [Catellatospora sp. NPDC049609]|uniref:hypothetical protein n=1 Tax=Catellatospora sp. NPDC049609 TaxID=3155505 RepID=UPI00344280C0